MDLQTIWEGRTPVERAVVAVLAVGFEEMARTTILVAVRALGHQRGPDGRSLKGDNLDPVLQGLVRDRVIAMVGGRYRCDRALGHAVLLRLASTGALAEVGEAVGGLHRPDLPSSPLWVALHARDFPRAAALARGLAAEHPRPFTEVLEGPLDVAWLRGWPEPLLVEALDQLLERALLDLEPSEEPFACLASCAEDGTRGPALRALLAVSLALRGRADEAPRWLDGAEDAETFAAATWLAFLRRDPTAAGRSGRLRAGFAAAGARPRSLAAKLGALGCALALVEAGDPERAEDLQRAAPPGEHRCWSVLPVLAALPAGWTDGDDLLRDHVGGYLQRGTGLEWSFRLCLLAASGLADKFQRSELERFGERARSAGWRWLADEFDAAVIGDASVSRLRSVFAREEPWARALSALERVAAAPVRSTPAAEAEPLRLAWVLSLRGSWPDLRPVEQRRDARGQWTQGRRVSLERLHEGASKMAHLNPQDRDVLRTLLAHTERVRGYPETTYTFDTPSALRALAGHPYVYLEGDPPSPVTLAEGPPSLVVERDGGHLVLRLDPTVGRHQSVAIGRVSPTRLRVVFPTEAQVACGVALGDGVRVPSREAPRVSALVAALDAQWSSRPGGPGQDHGGDSGGAETVLWREEL
ncbi:MAG: hypothetical protein HY909_03350 [Deltaproteobacteria bacterium]|nr:hypothetical protein [Deltaproteobacteria bacterium]